MQAICLARPLTIPCFWEPPPPPKPIICLLQRVFSQPGLLGAAYFQESPWWHDFPKEDCPAAAQALRCHFCSEEIYLLGNFSDFSAVSFSSTQHTIQARFFWPLYMTHSQRLIHLQMSKCPQPDHLLKLPHLLLLGNWASKKWWRVWQVPHLSVTKPAPEPRILWQWLSSSYLSIHPCPLSLFKHALTISTSTQVAISSVPEMMWGRDRWC